MRLLITADTLGGVWTYTRELTEGLLARGHDVLLASMGRLPSSDQLGWAARAASRWPHSFRYVPADYPLEWMQQNERCYRDAEGFLMEQVDAVRPDIIHLSQFCYGALPTAIPKVVIAHSDVVSWSECCRGCRPDNSSWFDQYLRVVSEGLGSADAVVAPTQWMLNALCRSYSVPTCRVVIANGRTLAVTHPRPRRRMQAVTIGRVWDEGKNVRLLEDVDSPLPILIGGELSLEDEPAFCSTRLRLLGHLSEQASLQLFAESAVYIITSRYEPFGLAAIEAALSGCAILAHDIPSLREVWGSSALYFDTAASLTHQLHGFCADRDFLSLKATEACVRARSLYSQDAMIEKYLDLYASLGAPVAAAETQHAS